MLWLMALVLLSVLVFAFLRGQHEERTILRDFEALLARRKTSMGGTPIAASPPFRTVMLWTALLVVVLLAWHFAQIPRKETSKKFTEFMAMLDAGQVADVTIDGNEIKGHTFEHEAFRTYEPPLGYDRLVDALLAKKVMVRFEPDLARAWTSLLAPWTPFAVLITLGALFTWQTLRGPVVHERWRLKREGYTALLKLLTELREHIGEADRVQALITRIASEQTVAQVWLRPRIILSLAKADETVRAVGQGATPHPDASGQAKRAIDEALELLAEGLREEFGLERPGF